MTKPMYSYSGRVEAEESIAQGDYKMVKILAAVGACLLAFMWFGWHGLIVIGLVIVFVVA